MEDRLHKLLRENKITDESLKEEILCLFRVRKCYSVQLSKSDGGLIDDYIYTYSRKEAKRQAMKKHKQHKPYHVHICYEEYT